MTRPITKHTLPDYHVLTTVSELEAAAEDIDGGNGPIAIDAERASGFRYSSRAYLIQVFRRGAGSFLFDPPAIGDFSSLAEAMSGTEWVLHAASQDLPCLREVGLDPDRVFDTELAARLLGRERVGLGAVVLEELGIELAKAHSAADWSKRPLPQEWLEYAALDVELLVDLRDRLATALDQHGKSHIASQEFEAVLRKQPKLPSDEPWRRLNGLHTIKDPRRMAVARELWRSRDAYAQEVDTAPGRLLPDSAIIALSHALPSSRSAVLGVDGFHGRAAKSQIERWWLALEAGKATADVPRLKAQTPDDAIPQPRNWERRNPEAFQRLEHAKPAVSELASVLQLPVENLLTPDYLRRVCWDPMGEDEASIAKQLVELGARPWQVDACAEVLAEAFVAARQHQAHQDPVES